MYRFATLTSEEIDEIVTGKHAENTKKLTDKIFTILVSYCKEKNITLDEKNITKQELDEI